MMTAALLVLGLAALLLHEYVVSSSRRSGLRATGVRFLLLVIALGAAGLTGPAVVAQLEGLVAAYSPRSRPVSPSGDAFLAGALARQQPEAGFPSGQTQAAVDSWRADVIGALRERAGLAVDAPSTVPVTRVGSETTGSVKRSLVRFTSWDGTVIPAYVHEPVSGSPKGAVLVIAGHGAGINSTAGLVDDYQHAAARELARHGYVTLSPELRGFGLLGLGGSPNHRWVAAAALEAGTSYKAIVAKDLGYALTVLEKWPGVDPSRLAVAGTSLGGELAVLFGALDPRIRAVLSHSYGGFIGPVTVQDDEPDDARQTPHGCHTIPGVNRILLQEDWARLVAPRPLLVVRGDRNRPSDSDAFERMVREAYSAHGIADRFVVSVVPGGHEFYLEPSLSFLARWL